MRDRVGDEEIQHTSESALLTAGWRAMESARSDALFHDPLAAGLAGERGLRIAKTVPAGAWAVAIRTVLIDAFVQSAISSGIDTVINLGAGLDTRPYRMHLPSSLHWVEVDYPSLMEGKTANLSSEVPMCSIERIGLDLTEVDARRRLFDRIWMTSRRAMVLMEGVLGDLNVHEAGELADDLRSQPGCESWVIDYFSPRLLVDYQKHQPHGSVPVRFDPPSWEAFMTEHGWRIKEIRFIGEESERLHRPVPLSRLDKIMRLFTSRPLRDMGYARIGRVPCGRGRALHERPRRSTSHAQERNALASHIKRSVTRFHLGAGSPRQLA
jgi:methyltransferase (TIGR00027 family)